MPVQWGGHRAPRRRRIAVGVLAGLALGGPALAACVPEELTLVTGDASSPADGGSDGSTRGDAGADAEQDAAIDVGVFDAPSSCDAAGVSCVPAAPTGWSGPFAFYEGPPATAPACAGNFPSVILDGHGPLDGSAGPAQCSACTCAAPPTTGCPANPTIQWYSDTTCQNACQSTPGDASAGCPLSDITCPSGTAMAFSVAGPSPGTCSASGGSATLPPIPWGSTARACAPPALPQSDCPSGDLCGPVPPSPFGATMCISRTASGSCPPGAYSNQIDVLGSPDDTRGCTSCSCGSLQGFTCGTLAINPGQDCFGPFAITKSVPAACVGLGTYSSKTSYSSGGAGSPDPGACTPSGGVPTGSVASAPVTICCQP